MTAAYEDNAEFNDYLDGIEDPSDEAKWIEIGEEAQFAPSRVLWEMDPAGYRTELQLWQERRRSTLSSLAEEALLWHSNGYRFDQLAKRAAKQKIIPFVGAGMSVPSGYLSWSDFLMKIASRADKPRADVESRVYHGQHEQIADELYREISAAWFDEHVEEAFGEDHPIRGGVKLLPKLFGLGCVTTNLDRVLERVYEREESGFRRHFFGKAPQGVIATATSGENWLLKLHGDALDVDSRVLCGEEYKAVYCATGNGTLVAALSWLFSHSSLLFLGCSLKGDRTLTVFHEVTKSQGDLPRHYAIVEEPAAEVEGTRAQREAFLTERQIFPIWYPAGEHDYVEAILEELRSQVQSWRLGGG